MLIEEISPACLEKSIFQLSRCSKIIPWALTWDQRDWFCRHGDVIMWSDRFTINWQHITHTDPQLVSSRAPQWRHKGGETTTTAASPLVWVHLRLFCCIADSRECQFHPRCIGSYHLMTLRTFLPQAACHQKSQWEKYNGWTYIFICTLFVQWATNAISQPAFTSKLTSLSSTELSPKTKSPSNRDRTGGLGMTLSIAHYSPTLFHLSYRRLFVALPCFI